MEGYVSIVSPGFDIRMILKKACYAGFVNDEKVEDVASCNNGGSRGTWKPDFL